jgi:hypothetical protein
MKFRGLGKIFENFYSNKLENLEEMVEFLDAFDLPKLNQEGTKNFNRSMSNEIQAIVKSSKVKPRTGRIHC